MKRVLYWVGLLTIAIPVLMPDVLALPFSADSKVLAQGSAEQNPSAEQYSECSLTRPSEEVFDADRGIPAGTKVYDCETNSDMSQAEHNDMAGCYVLEPPIHGVDVVCPAAGIELPKEPDSQNSEKDRGSQPSPPGTCRFVTVDANGTKVSDCGDKFLLEFSDGSKSLASPEQLFKQDGDQQQTGDQQQAGNQRSDDQQQDRGQQGGSDQGYGCAARV